MSSLRTRLWLSYSILILVILCVVFAGVVVALQRSPLLYRTAVLKLRLAEGVAVTRIEDLQLPRGPLVNDRVSKVIQREAENRQLRIAILDMNGTPWVDAGVGASKPLPNFPRPLQTNENDPNTALLIQDSQGVEWLYTLRKLDTQGYLLVATPRPNVPLRQILSDDILGPFIRAGLVAFILAVILALVVGQWIARPIHDVAAAARRMAEGQHVPIPPSGPGETRQLAEAFNEMAHRVQVSQQSQRDFIANVSHELKTPLTSIQGFSQAILDGTVRAPEALQQAAGVIYTESGRMYRLVLDLLVLARLEGGTADLQHTPLDLELLLKSVIEKFKPQAEKAQVTLGAEISSLPTMFGDGDRLAQVFTNLVDNALKFTPAGGSVQVSATPENNAILIRVRDTGPGIALQDQQRIFERFYQVDKSRRGGSGRGVGLGLPIAFQVIQAHQGRLWVESIPGQGATFVVRLPVAQPEDHTLNTRRPGI
jgi:two-component system OmpR family sensor kinase